MGSDEQFENKSSQVCLLERLESSVYHFVSKCNKFCCNTIIVRACLVVIIGNAFNISNTSKNLSFKC